VTVTAFGFLALTRALTVFRVVLVMMALLPLRGADDSALRWELSHAIVAATADHLEQDLLASVARFESNFEREVAECRRMGEAGDRTAWQVVPRCEADRRALCRSFDDDAAIALDRMRESIRACHSLPPPERLAVYARGSCSSAEGRRLSRIRWVSWGETRGGARVDRSRGRQEVDHP